MNPTQNYFTDLKTTLDQVSHEIIEDIITLMHKARAEKRQIFIMGNGGSASTASHFVCDLAKNTRHPQWPNYRVIGLADNMAILSAYANDEGYENVFVQQMASFLEPDDIVFGISTSGNSPNVVTAIEYANQKQAITIGFTGFTGGKLGELAQIHLHVPSHCIEHVEDIHLMLEHLICKVLREKVYAESAMSHG